MLALPLRLEGADIVDANGVPIALLLGKKRQYQANGAEIVDAVNSNAKLLKAAKRIVANGSHSASDWGVIDDLKAAIAAEEAAS
jgi:hypothetical protein